MCGRHRASAGARLAFGWLRGNIDRNHGSPTRDDTYVGENFLGTLSGAHPDLRLVILIIFCLKSWLLRNFPMNGACATASPSTRLRHEHEVSGICASH